MSTFLANTNLADDLVSEIQSLLSNWSVDIPLGSITLWYDEYGASVDISEWQMNELTYCTGANNNIDLEKHAFDVFEDYEHIRKSFSIFADRIVRDPNLKSYKLRKGFTFVLAGFDDLPESVNVDGLKTVDKTNDEDDFKAEGEKVLLDELGAVLRTIGHPYEITFSVSDDIPYAGIFFDGDSGVNHKYKFFENDKRLISRTLNLIGRDGEVGFTSFCKKILESIEIKLSRETLFRYLKNRNEFFLLKYRPSNNEFVGITFDEYVELSQAWR